MEELAQEESGVSMLSLKVEKYLLPPSFVLIQSHSADLRQVLLGQV